MKFKIVGWLNLILGGSGLITQAMLLFGVYPQMRNLYQDTGMELPASTGNVPFVMAGAMIMYSVVIYIGVRLAFGKNQDDRTFKWGVAALISTVILGGVYVSSTVIGLVQPIYQISGSI